MEILSHWLGSLNSIEAEGSLNSIEAEALIDDSAG